MHVALTVTFALMLQPAPLALLHTKLVQEPATVPVQVAQDKMIPIQTYVTHVQFPIVPPAQLQ